MDKRDLQNYFGTNTMLLAILKFNYNVNYIKRIKHTSIKSTLPYWKVNLMCDAYYYVLGKEG